LILRSPVQSIILTNIGILSALRFAHQHKVVIDGSQAPGASITRSSGAPQMRLFKVAAAGDLTLQSLLSQYGFLKDQTVLVVLAVAAVAQGSAELSTTKASLTLNSVSVFEQLARATRRRLCQRSGNGGGLPGIGGRTAKTGDPVGYASGGGGSGRGQTSRKRRPGWIGGGMAISPATAALPEVMAASARWRRRQLSSGGGGLGAGGAVFNHLRSRGHHELRYQRQRHSGRHQWRAFTQHL